MRNKSINIRLLIQAVCRHWRKMLLCGLIFAILGGGYKAYKIWPHESGTETADESTAADGATEPEESASSLTKGQISGTSGADYNQNQANIKTRIEQASEYMNHSILAKIDPNQEGYASVDITINTPELDAEEKDGITGSVIAENKPDTTASGNEESSDADSSTLVVATPAEKDAVNILRAYTQYVQYELDWTKTAQDFDTSPQYIRELIDVSQADGELNQTRTITVIYPTQEGAGRIMEDLISQLQNYQSTVEKLYGKHELKLDNQVTATIADYSRIGWLNSRLNEMNNLLNGQDTFNTATDNLGYSSAAESSTAQQVSRKSLVKPVVKYALAGFVGGIILYLIFGIFRILVSGVLYSAIDFNEQYGFRKIAAVPSRSLQNLRGLDWFFSRDDINYSSGQNKESSCQFAAEYLSGCIGSGHSIAAIGDLGKEDLESVAVSIKNANPQLDIRVLPNILTSPDDLKALERADAVVITAKTGVSRYNRINHILETVEGCGKEITGSIVIE